MKRPTLRLSPLENDASEDADHADSQHHHALEFEYDCDAPKCAIRVYVHLSPRHPLATKVDASGLCKLLVFETTTDGGFGKTLKFEDGAMLELGRFEYKHTAASSADAPQPSTSPDPEKSSRADTPAAEAPQRKKRFTNFYLRKRNRDRNVAGPALAVLDADAQPADGEDKKDAKEEEEGVRVNIRLVALDENGQDLPSPNEQATYLHVVRFGAAPTPVEGTEEGEDHRPWVVKVVKREATVCRVPPRVRSRLNLRPPDWTAHFPPPRDLRSFRQLHDVLPAYCAPSHRPTGQSHLPTCRTSHYHGGRALVGVPSLLVVAA